MAPADLATAAAWEALARQLQAALRATIFESRLAVTPRRLAQLADEAAADFIGYADGHNDAMARALGRRLAGEGLGHRAALALVEALHSAAETQGQRQTTAQYCTQLLWGYMEAREEHLLREQERTRIALERARARMES